ncbi:MAG: hypothetical protein AAGD22_16365 [Verrucomicrobiota bacterium]
MSIVIVLERQMFRSVKMSSWIQAEPGGGGVGDREGGAEGEERSDELGPLLVD